MTRRADLAKIHIGRKQLGMSDADYRALLHTLFGKDSAGELTTAQRWKLIQHMEKLGAAFSRQGRPRSKPRPEIRADYYEIPDHVPHARQKRYICALWARLGFKLSGLDARARKQCGVDRFLWVDDQAFLQTLAKDMTKRCKKRGIDCEA